MNRIGHQAAAQTAWLGYCAWLAIGGQPLGWQEVACGAVVASSMCADDWSPDADQGGHVARFLPGGHRGITHTPEVVALLLWGVHYVLAGRGYDWFAVAAAAAWSSHLLVDFVCGRIPFLILAGRRVGLGFRTGGPTEAFLTWAMTVVCLPLAWVALGSPNPLTP